jgi:cell division transport system ATP-binding protein
VEAELERARERKSSGRPRKGGAPIIEMRDVSKVYPGGHLALDRVSLAINRGDFVFLVGPTGCGKSTLIKLLIRELEPTDGNVSIAGRDVGQLSEKKCFRISSCFRVAPSMTTSPMRCR